MSSPPALRAVAALGIEVTLYPYADDAKAKATGLQAVQALGIAPGVLLKTLMVKVDGTPACRVIPSDRHLSTKKVAGAFGAKSATMMLVPKAVIEEIAQQLRNPTCAEL